MEKAGPRAPNRRVETISSVLSQVCLNVSYDIEIIGVREVRVRSLHLDDLAI